ncbi:MAG: hypothetical protein Sapg2KO_34450 [Saprospiraceae bacterium]
MKYYLIFFMAILFFWSAELPAQETIAELKTQLDQSEGKDKIDLQITLAQKLLPSDSRAALKYAEEAGKTSEASRYWLGLYRSSMLIADQELASNRLRKAANSGEDAVAAAKLLKDKRKELTALNLLIKIYQGDGRRKKLEETVLKYRKLESTIALIQREEELSVLQGDFEATAAIKDSVLGALGETKISRDSIEGELGNTLDQLGSTIREIEELEGEKLILENRTLALENDSIKNALEISEQERQLMIFDARTKKQAAQLQQLAIGLGAMALFLILLVSYFRLKRAAAAEKAAMQEQLMYQDKMATLGQMTAGIAHEIKNPLNFVNNFAEGSTFLLEDLEESLTESRSRLSEPVYQEIEELLQETKQNAVDILANGQRANQIINSMMDHARGETGQKEPVKINQLVQNNLMLAYNGFKANHAQFTAEISEQLDANLPSVQAIPQDIGRVLLNILNNAFEALKQQKEKGEPGFTPQLTLRTAKKGNSVCISIRDNAGGIPKEQQKQIYNPFFTTKPTGQGNTGLGLSISYDVIVTGHKGTLKVDSDGQTFSEFTIQLPIG